MEKIMSSLELQIYRLLNKLEGMDQSDPFFSGLEEDIARLVDIYADLEKLNQQKIDSDRKFSEDIRRNDLELHYRDALERDKMAQEREKWESELSLQREMEEKKFEAEKKSRIADAGIKAAGIVLPLSLYAGALALGMKLEFLDHGSVCSFTVKELFRKASTKTMM